MADKKNIVIRVNYPKYANTSKKPLSAPELITEWNVKRILLAIGAFILLCVLAFFIINNGQQNANVSGPVVQSDSAPIILEGEDSAGRGKKLQEYTEFEKISSVPPVTANLKPAPEQVEPLTEIKPELIKNKESINDYLSPIDDKRVSRALLTTGINNKEPVDEFTPPVKISNKQIVVLYYFTELKKLKDRALYHEWLRNGQVVAKRQLYIGDERWRTSSKMTFSDKNKGNWIVRLVDKSGQILNQKSFSVVLDE